MPESDYGYVGPLKNAEETGNSLWYCQRCGSAVPFSMMEKHDSFHAALAQLFTEHSALLEWAEAKEPDCYIVPLT